MLPASAAIVRDGGGDSTPDEDQGVIRCICGINDDDGFTIQCENCLVWQHAVCVGVEQDNVPDEYLCEKCNPRKLDVKKAIEYQKRRLDTEYRHSKETRKKAKYVAGKAKKTDDGGERKKRIHDGKQPRVKHTKGALGRDSSSPTVVRSGDGYRRESSSFADASYSQIEQNILGPDVQILFQSVLSQLAEQRDMVSAASASVTASAAVVAAAAAEPSESADTATSEHKSPESGMPSGTTAVSPTTAAPVSNKEDGIVAMPPPVRDNPSPLPSIVSMNSESLRSPAPTYSSFVAKGKSQIGLFSRGSIDGGRYICEYKGQVILKAAYKEDPKNYYDLLRTTRPHTHFHPEIDLCVDARRQGSEARFVRSSCTANAVLRSIHIADGAESQIHLGLFALRQIEPDEELTVAWKWEDGEMPAVARLSPSDAEDYLGRPEGRRMSKVWRQAFNGTSCGCADAQCVVRQLFAMLGVEESRADYGPEIKRRASRPPKAETDNPLSPLLAGSVRSPENGKSGRGGGHSRKTSDVGLDGVSADSPTSSAQRRQARSNNGYGFGNGSNADNVSGKASAEILGEHYVGDGQRKSSADSNFRQSLDRPSDMEDIEDDEDEHERCGSELRGANGDDPMDSVPMEPSSSENGRAKGGEKRGRKRRAWQVNGEAAHSAGPGSLGISTHGKGNGKRRRTSSNNPSSSSSSPTCHMLPQKKIWMSQYIELASASASANGTAEAVGDIGGFVIEEPSPKKSPKPAAAKPAESSQTASSDTPVVAPPAQTTAKTEQDLSMNADAEPSTGKPDLSVSILGTDAAGATKPASQDSPASGSAAALSASPSSPSHAAGGPSGGVPQNKAEQTTSEEAASEQTDAPKSPADEEPSTGGGDDATSALAVPAPKKQRLSLEEYNKRRRVSHAQGTTNKEEPALSSSAPAASTAAGAAGAAGAVAGDAEVKSETSNDSGSVAVVKELPPPTKVKVSLEEYNRRRKLSGTASIDSNITAAAAPKDSTPADLSSVASSVAPPAAVPASSTLGKTDVSLAGDAATKLSSGPGQTSPPTSADSVPSGVTIDTAGRRNSFSRTVRSPPPPPPISAPAATRPGDPQGRRGLLTPPPPIPHASSHPGSGRFDDRGPSTYSGGRKTNSGSQNEPYYRLERSAGGYYDDYDRERDRDGRDFRGRDRESYRDHDMKDRIRNRDFNTPPPPPPPMHGSMSASGPGFQGHGAYRQRDREFGRRDGSLERESGEISFGRGRSRSRDRGSRMGGMGDRDRRYGGPMGQGGGYYPSHNNNGSPPARSLTPQSSNSNSEWRSSGYAPPLLSPHHSAQAGGGSRGLSNSPPRRQQQAPDAPFASPHQQPLPGLSTTSGSPVAAGGGYRGINRRGGIGNNGGGSSRGDSPVRK